MIRALPLLLLLALPGCGDADEDSGELSRSEQRQLDEAAAAIDINAANAPENSQ